MVGELTLPDGRGGSVVDDVGIEAKLSQRCPCVAANLGGNIGLTNVHELFGLGISLACCHYFDVHGVVDAWSFSPSYLCNGQSI